MPKPEWSNELMPEQPPPRRSVPQPSTPLPQPQPLSQAPAQPQQPAAAMPRPQLGAHLHEPMMMPTSWEVHLAALAEKANETKPALYNIRSRNAKAPRVVHDFHGNKISIAPGTSKESILLHPHAAAMLGKSDLEITVA